MAQGAHGYVIYFPPGCTEIGAELVKWRASEVGAKTEVYTHTKLRVPDGGYELPRRRLVIPELGMAVGRLLCDEIIYRVVGRCPMHAKAHRSSPVCSLCSNRVLQYVTLVLADLLRVLLMEGTDWGTKTVEKSESKFPCQFHIRHFCHPTLCWLFTAGRVRFLGKSVGSLIIMKSDRTNKNDESDRTKRLRSIRISYIHTNKDIEHTNKAIRSPTMRLPPRG